jgi:helix-turn-helix, Psq domain
MPSKYIRKTVAHSSADFDVALAAIGNGMTVTAAAKQFDIPKSTLHDHHFLILNFIST